jgi:uncharacterized protein (UPF0332 family)
MEETFYIRANENLKAADMLFDAGLYNACANRAYYAAFHLTTAFLFSKNFKPVVDHRNVLSLFTSEFINKRKVFPSVSKKYIYDLQKGRNDADYKAGVSKAFVSYHLKKCKEFFEIVEKDMIK